MAAGSSSSMTRRACWSRIRPSAGTRPLGWRRHLCVRREREGRHHREVDLSGNRATATVGGILARGTGGSLTIANSTLSGNAADADGGGSGNGGGAYLYSEFDAGERVIRNSTIIGNTARAASTRPAHDNGHEDDHLGLSSTIVANNVPEDANDLRGPAPEGSFVLGFSPDRESGHDGDGHPDHRRLQPARRRPPARPAAEQRRPDPDPPPVVHLPGDRQGRGQRPHHRPARPARTFDAANFANAAGGDGTDIGSVELLPGGRVSAALLSARERRRTSSSPRAPRSSAPMATT